LQVVRYFEDFSYSAVNKEMVEDYDESKEPFASFLAFSADKKKKDIVRCRDFLVSGKMPKQLKWPALIKAEEEQKTAPATLPDDDGMDFEYTLPRSKSSNSLQVKSAKKKKRVKKKLVEEEPPKALEEESSIIILESTQPKVNACFF